MPINEAEFQVRGIRDPQLAVHATSGRPAWLWANDGTRILWANPAGAAIFGVSTSTALAKRNFGPADQHRRQVARLAGRLPLNGAVRLERLRGFGMSLGQLLTCACTRLVFTGGGIGVLVVALDPVGRTLPYQARLQGLVDDIDAAAVVAFTPVGLPTAANAAATALLATAPMAVAGPASLGLEQNIHDALHNGHAEAATAVGDVVLDRVGQGGDLALIAIITPPVAEEPEAAPVAEAAAGTETAAEPTVAEADVMQAAYDVAPPPAPPPPSVAEPLIDLIQPDTALESREVASAMPAPLADRDAPALVDADIAPPTAAAPTAPDQTSPVALADMSARDEPPAPPTVETEAAAPSGSAEPVPAPAPPAAEPIDRPVAAAPDERPVEAPATVDAEPSAHPADDVPHAAPIDVATPPPQPHGADSAPAPEFPPPLVPRRHPLRFMWQMDAEGRFALGSDEFSRLIGPRTATAFGRPWHEIVAAFGLDPEGRVAAAVATRDTWSGIVVDWPADGHGTRLPVELSGLPLYDHARQFLGYRGFGVCRDLGALARLAELRRHDALLPAQPLRPPQTHEPHDTMEMDTPMRTGDTPPPPSHDADPTAPPTETDTPVDTPQNVVPFRPANDLKTPTLTPIENNAFNELARQLAARLETERRELDARDEAHAAPPIAPEPPTLDDPAPAATIEAAPRAHLPHGDTRRDTLLYDRMPVGILIYRLDRLLYANKAFLAHVGYSDLPALTAAGGLDALYVEPGDAGGGSLSEEGTAVTIAAAGGHRAPTQARLHHIAWDGEDAHALIFAMATSSEAQPPVPAPVAPPPLAPATSVEEELGTILDATDDGILIFDDAGNIVTCNRGAETMFGYGDRDIVRCHLTDLFAPADHDAVRKAVAETRDAGATGRISQTAKGRTHNGDIVPLRLTLGRSTANGDRFFAIARREAMPQLPAAASDTPQPDRAAQARADILARISHEVRTPLNAIIGFTDVMVEERFGALGNERYAAYLKDIRAAGERVLTIINDMLDLSRAETGKLDLTFARQDLNDMVEKCVTIMQPQANRERIIIRTSLAHALPPVTADAGALRQIVLNLVGNSIHVARAGGQVIVSTALTDLGDVVLRIRDTGRGFNHSEADTTDATRPAGEQLAQDNTGINLSLTKALVEANRGQFHIKATPQAGTLVEVAFSPKTARAV
ncbi:MAG: PAS domain-containing protein [Pseudomonadota bacterium]